MHLRMMRGFVASAALLLGGCSLVVDVPADCENRDCAPYVCGADGIACMTTCAADDDCVAGFVCDAEAGACEPAGCEAAGEPIRLAELPERVDEFDIVAASDPEQLVVLLGNQDGLGFLRFDMTGGRVPDPIDESFGALPVAPANDDRSPFEPRIERIALADGAELLLFAWRANRDGLDRVEVTTFDPDAPSVPTVSTPYVARQRTLVNAPGVARTSRGLRAVWRETVGQGSTIYTIPAGDEDVDERPLTAEDESVGVLHTTTLAERAMLVASTASDGFERLDLYVVDENGVAVGRGRLQAEQSAQSVSFPLVDVAAGTDRWFALWGVESDDVEYRGAVLTPEDLSSLAGDSPTAVPSFPVGRDLSDVDDASATWRGDQLFLAWEGTRRGIEDIWVTRYTSDGNARFAPFPVTGGAAGAVDGVHVFSSVNGVDVVWRERRDEGDRITLRRYNCLP